MMSTEYYNSERNVSSSVLFRKVLKESHVKARRLDFPTRFLSFLPFHHHQPLMMRRVRFEARYGNEDDVRSFECVVRNGPYLKPTISRGWSQLLHDKRLRPGDLIIFYLHHHPQQPLHFTIQAFRPQNIKLFGTSILTCHPILP